MHESKQWTVLGIYSGCEIVHRMSTFLTLYSVNYTMGIQFQWSHISFSHSLAHPMQTKSNIPYYNRPQYSTLNPILMGGVILCEKFALV